MADKRMRAAGRAAVCVVALLLLSLLIVLPVMADPPTSGGGGRVAGGLAAGEGIQANSGTFSFSMPLLHLDGPLPLDLALNYRTDLLSTVPHEALASVSRPVNFQHTLLPTAVISNDEIYIHGIHAGELVVFQNQDDVWTLKDPSLSAFYALKRTASYLYLADLSAERLYIFHIASIIPRIAAYMDRNGNVWTYTYANAAALFPTRVSDGLGRSINLSYGAAPNLPLTQAVDQGNRRITYALSGDTYASITDAMNQKTTFRYQSGLVAGLQRPNGNTPYLNSYGPATLNGRQEMRVLSQTDALSNTTTFAYSAATNRVTLTLPYQLSDAQLAAAPARVIFEHFHNDGAPKSYTDQLGKRATYTQNARGQIASMTDRLGNTASYTYDAISGKLASLTNARGLTINLSYVSQAQTFNNPLAAGQTFSITFRNLAGIAFPDGTSEQFTYDAKGNLLTRTDQAGGQWEFTYNARGQMLTSRNPVGARVTNSYNGDGTLSASGDPETGISAFTYDALKRPTRITRHDASFIQIAYNANDAITSVTDERGGVTAYTYDANGNLIKATDPRKSVVNYVYNTLDRVTQFRDRLDKPFNFSYNTQGLLSQLQDGTGLNTDFGYDPRGWLNRVTRGASSWQAGYNDEGILTSRTTPSGHSETRQVDALGFVTSVRNALGQATTFARDLLSRVTAITNPLGRTTTYSYDNRGYLASVTLPATGTSDEPGLRAVTATYQRDALGNLLRITDLRGQNWQFTRNQSGQLLTSADPLGHSATYTHNAVGQLSRLVFPCGGSVNQTFDNTGNMTRQSYSSGLDLRYTYDANNRLTEANSITFLYNKNGSSVDTGMSGGISGGFSGWASHDDAGRVAALRTWIGNDNFITRYTYDASSGLLTRVLDERSGAQVDFTYDADWRLIKITRSNGVQTTYTWDNANRLTGIRDERVQAVTGLNADPLIDLRYTLDAAGQVAAVNMTAPLLPGPQIRNGIEEFTYDQAAQISVSGYSYDLDGRLTASPEHSFAWDAASRLVGVDSARLGYDGLDDVISRTVPGQTSYFLYNYAVAMSPIATERTVVTVPTAQGAEATATTEAFRHYVWTPDGRLLYMIDQSAGNKIYFFHFDRTGSTLALTDGSGALADAYAYNPYGKLLAHQGANTQPFTYMGRYGVRQEGNTGTLYQMGTRYYDATSGRYISRDPTWPRVEDARALNPYQFGDDNPLKTPDLTRMKTSGRWSPEVTRMKTSGHWDADANRMKTSGAWNTDPGSMRTSGIWDTALSRMKTSGRWTPDTTRMKTSGRWSATRMKTSGAAGPGTNRMKTSGDAGEPAESRMKTSASIGDAETAEADGETEVTEGVGGEQAFWASWMLFFGTGWSDPSFDTTMQNLLGQAELTGPAEALAPLADVVGPTKACFIATATYGSDLEPHVYKLRAFRDRYLLTNTAGRAFLRFYYQHSPAWAEAISQSALLRAVARALLTPLIYVVAYPLIAALICLVLLALALAWWKKARWAVVVVVVTLALMLATRWSARSAFGDSLNAGPAQITFSYDAVGRLTLADYGERRILYFYDDAGNIVRIGRGKSYLELPLILRNR